MKVKNKQLTFNQFQEFLINVVRACVDETGEVVWYMKNTVIKLFFCYYYLDVDINTTDLTKDYLSYSNISFANFKDDIAWYQFQDLLAAIESELQRRDEQYKNSNRPSVDKLLESIINYVDTMASTFENANIDTLQQTMSQAASTINKFSEKDIVKNILDTMGKESDDVIENDDDTDDKKIS